MLDGSHKRPNRLVVAWDIKHPLAPGTSSRFLLRLAVFLVNINEKQMRCGGEERRDGERGGEATEA